jgi:hypothetical protein
MKVFEDVFTGDELMTEGFAFTLDYEDAIMKVNSGYTTKDNVTVDVGCGNAFGGGEEETGDDANEEKVNNIQYNQGLTETQFSKGDFMTYMKDFLKKLKAHLEENNKDRVDGFMKGAQTFVKFVVSKFEDFTFYTGRSEKMDGSIAFSFWENEEAAGPVFYFFKDALREVKC